MAKNEKLPAGENLKQAAALFEERAAIYRANYWTCAEIMKLLFPDGVHLENEGELMRYQFLEHIVNKLTRYAFNFHKGGHADSSADSIVYWAMLAAADEELNK